MRSFVVSILVLALASSVHMQQTGLGGLLGGLGLGSGQQQGQQGLLGGLLGGLGGNGMQPAQSQNPLHGVTSLLNSLQGQNGQNMNQQTTAQLLSQLPRRTLQVMIQMLDGLSRALPGDQNSQMRNQMQGMNQQPNPNQMQGMNQQPNQNFLNGLTNGLPAPLNRLPNTLNSLTNGLPAPLNGLPNTLNSLTNQLTQPLNGLAQPQPMELQHSQG